MKNLNQFNKKILAVMLATTILAGSFFTPISNSYAASTSDTDIINMNPDEDDTDVAVNTSIKFGFTTDMDPDTIDKNSIYLEDEDGDEVSSSVYYDEDDRVVTLQPDNDLDYNTEYTVYITDDVEDENGYAIDAFKWSFTTEDDDDAIVINMNPDKDDTDVAVNTSIKFGFTTDMDSNTIDKNSIYLENEAGDEVASSVSYDEDDRVVTLQPNDDLDHDTEYTVYVTDDVEDEDGYAIDESKWSFTTEELAPTNITTVLDQTAPPNTISSTSNISTTNQVIRKGTTINPLIMFNNKYVTTDVKPYIKNNRTLIPIKALATVLGAQTSWDGSKDKVTIGNKVELYIGNKIALQNSKNVILETAPELKDNRTMVPLSFVARSLGVRVDWNGQTNTVVMTKI
jgi:hypothetical protein